MKTATQLEMETDLFKSTYCDQSMIIKVIANPFEKITDISWNENIIGLIDKVERADDTKSLLLLTDLEFCYLPFSVYS